VKKKGGTLRLAEIRPEILEVFYITKLNKHFSIDESAEAALKALA
jgi:anti-anti-sigma regulatory factor